MIKYLGSKRTLLPEICAIAARFPKAKSALDLFSGTSRVGRALKAQGLRVLSNDHNQYAHTLARAYVEADRDVLLEPATQLLEELSQCPPEPGYFTETFCREARFFQEENGAKVDAIREEIARRKLDPILEAVALTSLMEAADRVDSTCGVQMAYIKSWSARSYNALQLRVPEMVSGSGSVAHCMDANIAARKLKADLVYLDPPYNQHSYLSNYHIWETLIAWDQPEAYGVAQKRIDCRTRKSDYNSKRRHSTAFRDLIDAIDAPIVIVSFSDEGFQAREELEAILSEGRDLEVIAKDYKRYVGAQIGIHNPQGEVVGEVSHLRNTEYLYIVGAPQRSIVVDLAPAALQLDDR